MLAAGACVGLPTAAPAQQSQPPNPQAAAPAPSFTGHDFAGVRFKQAVVTGKLTFAATKAWSWTDGSTDRLVLDDHVRVTIAGYHFAAKRAAVWMESVPGAEGKDTRPGLRLL